MIVFAQGHWLTNNLIHQCAAPSQSGVSLRPGQSLQASRGEQATAPSIGTPLQGTEADPAIVDQPQQQSARQGAPQTRVRQRNPQSQQPLRYQQDGRGHRALTPMQMTRYIKDEWRTAARSMRKTSDPDRILALYVQRMDDLCLTSQNSLNYVHMSAILYGYAQIHMAAEAASRSFKLRQEPELSSQAFLSRMLVTVQQILPTVGSREASSILWSFAKIGLHPNSLVIGIVDGLAARFVVDIQSAKGQSYSSIMLACNELRLDPCNGNAMPAILDSLSRANLSAFSAQATANIVYCLAKVPRLQPTLELLDALCSSFLHALQTHDKRQPASPQALAHFVKSLQQLRYQPSATLLEALLSKMLDFCQDQVDQAVYPREISNFLLAYADLRYDVTQDQVDTLITQLLADRRANAQDFSNAAWATAVLGRLQLDQFRQLLRYLHLMEARQNKAQIAQLYQALDWLDASSDARLQHSKEWADIEFMLDLQGPRPAVTPSTSDMRSTQAISAALVKLGLRHSEGATVRSYWMHAVVQPSFEEARNLLITCVVNPDCFINHPTRLTGRAAFWRKILALEGAVVEVSLNVAEQTVDDLASALEPLLNDAAGGNLDFYRI